ncbi:MAG: hypothetical protein AMS22_08470 [Thiotrichales bacterium SG8_50]|nr:MAG: hypothetical protein AMS22_08470 [Thiotrichales bacterium SG8_50]
MDKPRIREKHGPEWKIQQDLIKFLRARGWLVEVTQGNMFQKGFPDLFISHPKYGQRWIDVKNPVSYTFTKDQRRKWPVWAEYGVGIWILVGANDDEYDKLFTSPNWKDYWKPKWDEEPTVDDLMAELENENWEEL